MSNCNLSINELLHISNKQLQQKSNGGEITCQIVWDFLIDLREGRIFSLNSFFQQLTAGVIAEAVFNLREFTKKVFDDVFFLVKFEIAAWPTI